MHHDQVMEQVPHYVFFGPINWRGHIATLYQGTWCVWKGVDGTKLNHDVYSNQWWFHLSDINGLTALSSLAKGAYCYTCTMGRTWKGMWCDSWHDHGIPEKHHQNAHTWHSYPCRIQWEAGGICTDLLIWSLWEWNKGVSIMTGVEGEGISALLASM